MKKNDDNQTSNTPANGDQRLVVWGERRKDPDWDAFLAALIAYALREVEQDEDEEADA